jgi:type IV fimbrial biogenesis protein FimT
MKRLARGFSVLEVIVVVAIIGLLLSLGVPSFFTYTQNMQIRSAAEQVTSGLQIAKNEAIRRNALIQMSIDTGTAWTISDTNGNVLQTRANEGTPNVTKAILPTGTNIVTFNGMGRIASANDDGTVPMTQVDLDNPMISNVADRRKLRIVIPVGGAVRMCDPAVSATTDPRICP